MSKRSKAKRRLKRQQLVKRQERKQQWISQCGITYLTYKGG